jgi:hypothetical protein
LGAAEEGEEDERGDAAGEDAEGEGEAADADAEGAGERGLLVSV